MRSPSGGRTKTIGAILLGIVVLAGVAWFRARESAPRLPPGSSLSTQPNGTRALFLWLEAAGARPERLMRAGPLGEIESVPDPSVPPSSPGRGQPNPPAVPPVPAASGRGSPRMMLVVQPVYPTLPALGKSLQNVAEEGGTLVLAGDSFSLVSYVDSLGFDMSDSESAAVEARSVSAGGAPDGGPSFTMRNRRRITPNKDLTPVLMTPRGEWLGAQKSVGKGTLMVFTSAYPFTNEGLRDPAVARFVYSKIVSPAVTPPTTPGRVQPVVVFDESLKSAPAELGGGDDQGDRFLERRMVRWMVRDPIGGATTYAAVLLFLYLLLSGQRLGPALRPTSAGSEAGATAGGRTMFEHVQALAGLYRRGGQILPLRAHYARHYRKLIARTLGTDAPLAARRLTVEDLTHQGLQLDRATALVEVVSQIENAGSEKQLGAAVRRAEDLTAALTAAGRPGGVATSPASPAATAA